MRSLLLLPLLIACIGAVCANGLEATSFYILPLKEFTPDRDALAHYAPGGSVHKGTVDQQPDFELSWSDSAISITLIKNDPAELKKDYGKLIQLTAPSFHPNLEKAFNCKTRLKIKIERGGFATITQSARQILLCDKINQLGGGFILTSQGIYLMNGQLISTDQKPATNLFFPPPKL